MQWSVVFLREETLLASPKTEARKLFSLKSAINAEKTRILTLFASETPIDKSMRKTLNQKLFEIERLNQMLGPIDTIFASEATSEAVQKAKDQIKNVAKMKYWTVETRVVEENGKLGLRTWRTV